MKNIRDKFSEIYCKNTWVFGSGLGSVAENTAKYREILISVIQKYNIKTVLDYGCGDWQSSKLIDWDNLVDSYVGVDVVPELIEHHTREYSSNKIKFANVDETWVWPTTDLIICKDVLQHNPNDIIIDILNNMKKHAKFILLTEDCSGHDIEPNLDCEIGGWRPLEFSMHPFNLDYEILCEQDFPADNLVKRTMMIET